MYSGGPLSPGDGLIGLTRQKSERKKQLSAPATMRLILSVKNNFSVHWGLLIF